LQEKSYSVVRQAPGVAVWQEGDCGEDVFARARLALEGTPAVTS